MKSLNSILLIFFILSITTTIVAENLAITVTNSNVALVRETRELVLDKGIQQFNLVDIPTEIQPSSVLVESKKKSFSVLEQNYEYDLVGVSKVLKKSLNQNIRLIHPELGDLSGKLISVSSQYLMLLDDQKQMQIIPRSDELKISLKDYADKNKGFITRPTLVWQVQANSGGRHHAQISYLTGGLNWNADYVGRLSDDEKILTLASWVTIENNSGKTYTDARLKLMAGDLNLVKTGRGQQRMKGQVMEMYAAAPSFSEKAFFEYHLYSLNRITTLANNQVKQIQLFPETSTIITKKYIVDSQKGNEVNVMVSFKNSKENQLGFALPGGKIRLYKADGKDMEFIGEDKIEHTPENEELKITVGQAFDVVAERIVVKTERPTKRSRRQVVEYILRNHKKNNIDVEIVERLSSNRQNELVQSDIEPFKKQADRFSFKVTLKAKGEYKLKMEYVTTW